MTSFAALDDLLEELRSLPAEVRRALKDGKIPEKRLLTYEEAGSLVGLSERKMRELCRRGEIPTRRVDSSIRIAVTDLDAWINSLTEDA